jgi:hypothetical protein
VAALAAASIGVVLTAGPASATPRPTIPADVAALFSGEALRQAQALDAGLQSDFSRADRSADIHQVFRFSPAFIGGDTAAEPVIRTEQWQASIKRGGEVLGTVMVWRQDGAAAQVSGFSDDVALGSALGTVAASEILIMDDPNGAVYALAGTTVRPLNGWARKVLPAPAQISELQDTVARQYASLRAQSAEGSDMPEPPGSAIALGGMALTLLAGVAMVVAMRRRGNAVSRSR